MSGVCYRGILFTFNSSTVFGAPTEERLALLVAVALGIGSSKDEDNE